MKKPGTFTISIDLELAWGVCDRRVTRRLRHALEQEREIVPRILKLFHTYDMRATWAVVAHLMLANCARDGGTVHPEIPRPVTRTSGRDWFAHHPDGPDPLWHGRDLVELIRDAHPAQHIASHSFCHMPYEEAVTHPAAVQADVRAARAIHRAFHLPFDAFVFPRNRVGYREVLAEAGIRAYRGWIPRLYDGIRWRPVRLVLNFISLCIPSPAPTVTARQDDTGMLNVPASMLLHSGNGLRRLVSRRRLTATAIAGLHQAAERGEIFHLWFHPANFAHRMDEQFEILETILGHAQGLRQHGQLEVATLVDIVRQATGRERGTAPVAGLQHAPLPPAGARGVPSWR